MCKRTEDLSRRLGELAVRQHVGYVNYHLLAPGFWQVQNVKHVYVTNACKLQIACQCGSMPQVDGNVRRHCSMVETNGVIQPTL